MNYNHQKIEQKWQQRWRQERLYEPDIKKARKPFYNLMMFPYPSAEGLHVGNMYAFVGSDIYGRYQRMRGQDVFEPIGLDGFGIHSENFALKIGAHPMDQSKKSQEHFYQQLQSIGNGFAWQEKLETYDPDYYRWTQWIFVQMFKRGLAYRKKATVNWCPSCQTVLADEQVVAGQCERCRTVVAKKELEQWFFKITNYAERLLNNLGSIDWSEKVKTAQRNWIGRSEGANIKFKISNLKFQIAVEIFTTRPDTLAGATYLVLAPEHPLLKNNELRIKNYGEVEEYIKKAKKKTELERQENKEKTGIELQGIKAVNPLTEQEISVWVADYALAGYGTGAIMAVPAHDQRDWQFAQKYKLPALMVICPNHPHPICPILTEAYEGEGVLVGSGKFDGLPSVKARAAISDWLKQGGRGGRKITYKLRDWLISRQRYWGPPIPLIFCDNCRKRLEGNSKLETLKSRHELSAGERENPGWTPVAEENLPVLLPRIENFRPTGTGVSPLAGVKSFAETICPRCGGDARRETDVSDTFLDSAWYYFRYPSVQDKSQPWSSELTKKWLPVNMYIGGAEHSVLHLLYARFLAMVFHDWGLTDFEEPFSRFRAHGLLIHEGAKMSKSKGNVINPDWYIGKFGADTLRLYLMFIAPFEQGGDFRDQSIAGIFRFLNRVWRFCTKVISSPDLGFGDEQVLRVLHQTIKKVTADIEQLQYNTAVSALMVLLRALENGGAGADQIKIFLKLLAPFAPHLTEELWRSLGETNSIHYSPWPAWNRALADAETVEVIIQINGKMRSKITVAPGGSREQIEALARSQEKIQRRLDSQKIQKTVFVPDRLINFIVS